MCWNFIRKEQGGFFVYVLYQLSYSRIGAGGRTRTYDHGFIRAQLLRFAVTALYVRKKGWLGWLGSNQRMRESWCLK